MHILKYVYTLFRTRKRVLSIIAILLLSMGNLFTQTALAAPVSMKLPTQTTTFTLDGVTVTVDTPFLPASHFSTSKPGDATQTAVAATPDPKVHPYGAISITAVPFGTKPKSEGVPIAQAGGAATYRANLHQYRVEENNNPQPGPVITIFGQQVVGEASLIQGDAKRASTSTLIVEWVVQAGKRIWIVRITQEEAIGAIDIKSAAAFLASLSFLTITSSTLSYPTTVKVTRTSMANTSLSDLPYPDWWATTCVDRSGGFGSGGRPLATSYRGMTACGPTNTAVCSTFGGRASCVYEWQCVELAMRYFVLTGWASVYPGNGVDIVNNYPNSNLTKFPATRDGSQQLSIQGRPFQAGDVLSWADMNNYTTPSWSSAGHVSIVTGVSVNSSGTGSFSVIEENGVTSGTEMFSINNWLLQDSTWTDKLGNFHRQRMVDWLDPNSGGPTSGGGSGLASASSVAYNVTGKYPEVFARGTDGTIWHDWPSASGGWANWTQTQSGYQFQGSPTVIWNASQNHLEVFALGVDGNIWHDWPSAGGSWANWTVTQSGPHFQGSPTVAYNVTGNYPEIFAIGVDGTMWHDWPSPGSGWANWTQTQSGYQFQGSPTVIWNASQNHLEVFAVGADGNMWHDWPSAGGSWANWTVTQSGPHFQGSPTVAYNVTGNYPEVFALGVDGNMWHDWPSAGGSWANWTQTQSGYQFQGSPTVVWNASQNHLEVFALGVDGNMWHDWPSPSGGWMNWTATQSGPHFQSSPAVVYNVAPNYPEVFALGVDGNMWHDWPSPSSGWANWTQT